MDDTNIMKPKTTEQIDKVDELELVITPKKEFLKWFKHTKGLLGKIVINESYDGDTMECPNCKSSMKNYQLNDDPDELWHLCSKCKLSFSHRQHIYFTTMILRLINSEFNPPESDKS